MTQEAIQVSETPPLPGLQLVQQVNGALETIATDFAGATDPAADAGAYMVWADTANGVLKRRNSANTAWTIVGNLSPIASQAEVDAGTSDDKFATPLKLRNGFSINIAAIGHIKFPSWLGDLQICWGNPSTAVGGGVAVAFSRAFSAVLAVVATVNGAAVFPLTAIASSSNTTGTFFTSTPSGTAYSGLLWFIAIGKG